MVLDYFSTSESRYRDEGKIYLIDVHFQCFQGKSAYTHKILMNVKLRKLQVQNYRKCVYMQTQAFLKRI